MAVGSGAVDQSLEHGVQRPNVSPHGAPGDPLPEGWIAQLVALVRTVVLHPSWSPTLRMLLIAVVAAGILLAVRVVP